jgi:hypothetical protein
MEATMMTPVVSGIVSAVVAGTISIVVTSTDHQQQVWGVTGGVAALVVVLFGYILAELRLLRRRLVAGEMRTGALAVSVDKAMRDHIADPHAHPQHQADPAARRRRRSRPRHRPNAPSDTGELLSRQFQMYLRGRESRRDEGPPIPS